MNIITLFIILKNKEINLFIPYLEYLLFDKFLNFKLFVISPNYFLIN